MNKKNRNPNSAKLLSIICAFLVGISSASLWAQPTSGHIYRLSANSTEILSKTETQPTDDSVLAVAPASLSLNFPARVRLVKLILRDENHQWVDIDFRYSPRPNDAFQWQLPVLPEAAYYTADWAILGYGDQLIRGSFSFAFGPEAQPPSIYKEAERLLLESRYGDPTIRYVAPPRTTIILPEDERSFDPPFTIDLTEPADPQ
ncbi:MAG: copper resistance protein CopC [Pseudomonadales bacterium]|nr:copper resistance protein CopC [Pseudomonadales bacterium]